MAQPDITKLSISGGDTVVELESITNTLIDQSIKDASMTNGQTMVIETQDETNITFFVTKAKDGILSGLEFSWSGPPPLTADIAAGNWQADGKTSSSSGVSSISFAARHASLPRLDLVSVDIPIAPSTPTFTVTTGTPSANPQPPSIPSGSAPLYLVWIDPSSVAVPNDFVIGTYQVDTTFPVDGAQVFANGVRQDKTPTVPKMADFTPLSPNWDADVLFVDATAGVVTMDLPDPTAYSNYERKWLIVAIGATANTITLDATASGAFTVNGAANDTITNDYQQYTLIARGGTFYGN